jgi:hypothetical protein
MAAKDGRPTTGSGILKDERGMALIIVLVMLLLLSILSATMLVSSTTDLQIAGNYRNNEQTFFEADAAMNFAQTYDQIYTTLGSTIGAEWPPQGQGQDFSPPPPIGSPPRPPLDPNYNRIQIPGSTDTADIKVHLLSSGGVPAGSGTQVDSGISPGSGNFKANYFAINVIANGPNNVRTQLESQVARIVQQ